MTRRRGRTVETVKRALLTELLKCGGLSIVAVDIQTSRLSRRDYAMAVKVRLSLDPRDRHVYREVEHFVGKAPATVWRKLDRAQQRFSAAS